MSGAGLTAALWASTLVDAVAAGLALFVPGPRQAKKRPAPSISFGRLLLTAAVTAVVLVIKVPVLSRLGLSFFGVIHLLYLDVFVLLPLAGVGVLLAGRRDRSGRRRRRVTGLARLTAWGCVAIAPVGAYATCFAPFRLRLETAQVPLPAARDGSVEVRIGVLADLQTSRVTDYERSAVQRLLDQRPDLILIPGDLFQGSAKDFERELPALRALLSRLSAPGGVYFVLGNVDSREQIERVLAGTRVRLLINEVVAVEIGDRRLTIGGLELAVDAPGARRTMRQLETAPGDGDIRILVTHLPDAVLLMEPDSRIDLVVAGHTHGGQVQLPFFGPPFTASRVPRRVAAGGYHDLAGRRIYVSRGVGHERGQAPRIRFLAPPELSLLTLAGT